MKKVIAAFLVLLVVLGVALYFAQGKQETGAGGDTGNVAEESERDNRAISSTRMDTQKEKRAMMLKQALAAMAQKDENRREQKPVAPVNAPANPSGGNVGDKFNPKDVQYDIEKLEKHLENGEKDEKWQAGVVAHVNELFENMQLKGSSVASVECTTTLCKLRLRHNDHAAFQEFGAVKNFDGPWDKGDRVGTLSINDDALYTRLFFSKEGTKLPTD